MTTQTVTEKEQYIEEAINQAYTRNTSNLFNIYEKRRFKEEIEDLKQFLNAFYMNKTEIHRTHDNFNWEALTIKA